MTLERLKQYRAKKNELKSLEEKILDPRYKHEEFLFDTVVGSSHNLPYQPHATVIQGYGSARNPRISKRIARYKKQAKELRAELDEIEMFMDTVSNSEIRQIIRHKYIDGRGISWNTVARRLYGYPCGDKARKKITRFFEKI